MGHQPRAFCEEDRRQHYVQHSESLTWVGVVEEEDIGKEQKTNFATNKIHKIKEKRKYSWS
jgi:hypothetical protein